jgi:hypothetical protein
MQSSGKWWKKTLAAGLISSALFAGTAFGAENRTESRMRTQKVTASRRAASEGPRLVNFKTEQTDSWLCLYVSPFFCSAIPNVAETPQPGTTTTTTPRGRR